LGGPSYTAARVQNRGKRQSRGTRKGDKKPKLENKEDTEWIINKNKGRSRSCASLLCLGELSLQTTVEARGRKTKGHGGELRDENGSEGDLMSKRPLSK